MEFIYPENGSMLTIPRQLNGKVEGIAFQLAVRDASGPVWWHLDGEYVGETRFMHSLRLLPGRGRHTIVAVDSEGSTASVQFTVTDN